MTPQQLRNSILQQAIEGKLVEQRPEEGTAEELYAQIQDEKKELIAEKKIKKEKPLPEISEDEIPFDIPESWKWVRLGNLISIKSGEGLVSSKMKEGNIPVYGGNGVTGYHNEALVNEETIVIGRVGFYCGSVHITEKKAWVTDNAFITSYSKKFIDMQFLVYWLRHLKLGENNNATAQPVVSGKKIYPLLFPLPPLAEQKRIVAKIEELLPFIDKYEKAYNALEKYNARFPDEMRKSILQQAIEGKLVEQRPEEGTAEELYAQIQEEKKKLIAEGKIKKEKPLSEITEDEIPFDIPESWKWVRLAFLGTIYGGGTPKTTNAEFWGGDIAWITPTDLNGCGQCIGYGKKNITLEGLQHSSAQLFPKDSIIISSRAPIGYIAIAKNEATTSQGCKTFSAYSNMLLDTKYIFYVITARVPDLITRASGTTFKEISGTGVGNTVIPLPPLAEQKRIVAKIEELLPYCDMLKQI